MRVSLFSDCTQLRAETKEMTWDRFVMALAPIHLPDVQKHQVPSFSPAEFSGGVRANRNVIQVWFGVLDLDLITLADLTQVKQSLDGLESVIYTTGSHPGRFREGLYSVRVCLNLAKPVDPADWFDFWASFVRKIGPVADPMCRDMARVYARPFFRSQAERSIHWFQVFHGQPWNP